MKKFAVICLLLAALHARGDFIVVEKFQAAGKDHASEDITVRIKGDKARVDVGSGGVLEFSTIINTRTGDRTTLFHESKSFMKMSGVQTEVMLEELKKKRDPGADSGGEPKVGDTGKKEKVGDYEAEIYTMETPKLKFTFWISKDVPGHALLRDELKKAQVMEVELSMGELPDLTGIEGVPVKTEVVSKANDRIFTVTLVSAKEAPVEDAEFQIPADYKEGQEAPAPE